MRPKIELGFPLSLRLLVSAKYPLKTFTVPLLVRMITSTTVPIFF